MKPEIAPVAPARRRWFAAAGTLGALAAVASVAPRTPAPSAPEAPPAPQRGGGYRLSAHVRRYYDTTRV